MQEITIKRYVSGCTQRDKTVFERKNMEFSYSSFDMNRINSPSLIDELKLAFDLARPMYSFWADAYDNMLDKGIIKPEDAIR